MIVYLCGTLKSHEISLWFG